MSLWDLVLTQGQGKSFDDITLKRLEKQEQQFNKPVINYSLLSFILLALIAYLVLKK